MVSDEYKEFLIEEWRRRGSSENAIENKLVTIELGENPYYGIPNVQKVIPLSYRRARNRPAVRKFGPHVMKFFGIADPTLSRQQQIIRARNLAKYIRRRGSNVRIIKWKDNVGLYYSDPQNWRSDISYSVPNEKFPHGVMEQMFELRKKERNWQAATVNNVKNWLIPPLSHRQYIANPDHLPVIYNARRDSRSMTRTPSTSREKKMNPRLGGPSGTNYNEQILDWRGHDLRLHPQLARVNPRRKGKQLEDDALVDDYPPASTWGTFTKGFSPGQKDSSINLGPRGSPSVSDSPWMNFYYINQITDEWKVVIPPRIHNAIGKNKDGNNIYVLTHMGIATRPEGLSDKQKKVAEGWDYFGHGSLAAQSGNLHPSGPTHLLTPEGKPISGDVDIFPSQKSIDKRKKELLDGAKPYNQDEIGSHVGWADFKNDGGEKD